MAAPLLVAGGAAALGAIGSALGTSSKNERLSKARKELSALKQQQAQGYQDLQTGLSQAYSPYTQNAQGDFDAYRGAAGSFGTQQREYAGAGDFNFDLNAAIDSLMDPYLSGRTEAATKALEGSAANAGKLNSSATLSSLAKKSGELYSDAWKDALGAAQRQQAQEYGQWSDSINRERQAVDQYNANLMRNLEVLGALSNTGMGATLDLAGKKTALGQESLTNQGNLDLERIKLGTQKGSVLGNALTGGLNVGANVLGALSNMPKVP